MTPFPDQSGYRRSGHYSTPPQKRPEVKTNFSLRYASNPRDAKNYDTARLREEFLVERLMVPDEINLTYSMYDRLIVGGAMPVDEALRLEPVDILRADYFTERREVGIINVGGAGTVTVEGETYTIGFKEALYTEGFKDTRQLIKSK